MIQEQRMKWTSLLLLKNELFEFGIWKSMKMRDDKRRDLQRWKLMKLLLFKEIFVMWMIRRDEMMNRERKQRNRELLLKIRIMKETSFKNRV